VPFLHAGKGTIVAYFPLNNVGSGFHCLRSFFLLCLTCQVAKHAKQRGRKEVWYAVFLAALTAMFVARGVMLSTQARTGLA